MVDLPGVWRLDHKLHPRTGFMIFFPGFILLLGLIMIVTSAQLQTGGAVKGLAAVFTIDAAVVCSLLWSDFGHALSWDDHNVYLRQYGGRIVMRRHRYVSVPFSDIRGLVFHPPPRGVPPKYPLLELDAPSSSNEGLLSIDPNYFTASSLARFINDLRQRIPAMRGGKQGLAVDRLLKALTK